MKKRCAWLTFDDPLYVAYHDNEWGVPLHDDARHFEFLLLETMQAGLSWRTVLHKRENFRKAFAGFDPAKIIRFDQKDVQRLLSDAGIIRNKVKILSVINNAHRFLEISEEFGSFDAFIWRFVGGKPIKNGYSHVNQIPASTKESDTLSKDLKRRGFKFVGSTTCYAHMQAAGLVNDHTTDCFRYHEVS
ncbi:DNA-3-methyladenine glycosylase I [candidate division KSB1 bacterium]